MNSPGRKIGNGAISITSRRRKSRVFHVMSASGLARMALAKIGASSVGSMAYARRIARSGGGGVTSGGIMRKARQPVSSSGNFSGMFRSVSSITCGERIGASSREKQAARMIPAAPVGEFKPARIALVSRNTRNLRCIALAPDLPPSIAERLENGALRVARDSFSRRQGEIGRYFEALEFTFEPTDLIVESGRGRGVHSFEKNTRSHVQLQLNS